MTELFVELYSEEIPVKFFNLIEAEIKNIIINAFQNFDSIKKVKENNFCNIFENDTFCKVYFTPCRIILYTNVLSEFSIIKHKEIFGPKIDASKEEISGFLKAFNLNSVKELEKRDNNYILVRNNLKIKTKDIIKQKVYDILYDIANSSHKVVKWDNLSGENRWFSPLRNILCLFDGETINFNFCGLESNNYTYGHKTMIGLDKKIEIKNFEDYKLKMKENFVIFDHNERKKIITNKIEILEKELNSYIIDFNDDGYRFKEELIDEIVGTTEFPNVFCGKFNEEFLKLPEKIISIIISKDFRCFCLKNKATGLLSNSFILFGNIETTNNGENLINGNINVINSRLNFTNVNLTKFISESIETKINKLKVLSFHKYVGTTYNRVERIMDLSKFICLWIPNCDLISTENAAQLCKIDLTTSLIKSNPELKGFLSSFYAKMNSYPEVVYEAIEEYYEPRSSDDPIPQTNIGKIISIAGKLDNIITLFITNEETTSSKDPYGIRKDIMSIIRIIVEGQIDVPLELLIHKSISLFRTGFYKKNKENERTVKQKIINIEKDLIELFKIKFASFLIDLGYDQNIINSVINQGNKNKVRKVELNLLYKKIIQVDNFSKNYSNKFVDLKSIYKRINNISPDFKNSKINLIFDKVFLNKKFINRQEKVINLKTKEISKKINLELKSQNYSNCLKLLYEFNDLINKYFEDNLVKTDNNKETNGRLSLLLRVKNVFDKVINFSELSL